MENRLDWKNIEWKDERRLFLFNIIFYRHRNFFHTVTRVSRLHLLQVKTCDPFLRSTHDNTRTLVLKFWHCHFFLISEPRDDLKLKNNNNNNNNINNINNNVRVLTVCLCEVGLLFGAGKLVVVVVGLSRARERSLVHAAWRIPQGKSSLQGTNRVPVVFCPSGSAALPLVGRCAWLTPKLYIGNVF